MNNWCICWFFMHPLNVELNPICHLLALLGGATILVVSRLRVNPLCVLGIEHPSSGGITLSVFGVSCVQLWLLAGCKLWVNWFIGCGCRSGGLVGCSAPYPATRPTPTPPHPINQSTHNLQPA